MASDVIPAPATAPKYPPRVKADEQANESWIVSGYHFFRHGTLESAVTARDHLAAQFPKKNFRVWRLKASLQPSRTKAALKERNARIAALVAVINNLLAAIDADDGSDSGCMAMNSAQNNAIAALAITAGET